MTGLVSANVSNCPSLTQLMLYKTNNSLTTLDLTGTNNLVYLTLHNAGFLNLDLTGKTALEFLKLKSSDLTSITGMSTLSSLRTFKAGHCNNLVGNYDFANYDTTNFYKFCIKDANSSSVANWGMVSGTIDVLNVFGNNLTLNNASQIHNEITTQNKLDADMQIRYGGDTIPVGSTKDYSSQAVIDINGVNVTSNFVLHNVTLGTVVSTNNTGIFNFPNLSDTGEYYVGMSNPGGAPGNNFDSLTTNHFWVQCTSVSASQTLFICNGDSVVVGTSVYNTSGTYVDVLTAAGGCDSTVTTYLTVNAPIDATTTNNNDTITANQTGATYQWIDCGSGSYVGATGQTYVSGTNGSFAVEVTYNGCIDTSACVNVIGVGIDEHSSITANIYPNPFTDQFTIELGSIANNTQLKIVSVEGKVVYSENNLHSSKLIVNASNWSKGIYFVRITNNDGTNTFKLVK